MDYAYKQTDIVLADLEKRIKNVYGDAAKELQTVIDEYFEKLKSRDEHQRKLLEDGQITETQYRLWRMAQIGRGERFEALRDEIARRCNQANQVALAYVNDSTPGIYSLNYNYSAYTIERVHGNVGFTLFDEQTVRRLIAKDPELLPAPRINIPKDLKWNREKLQRELVTGIMLGESTGEIADRFQSVTDMNRVSALRNARTAVTSAQNAGRQASMDRAKGMGIKQKKQWISANDMRTRHSHGMLDGQIVEIDECFISELGSKMMYPGDREHGALACDVYNCRCTMVTVDPLDADDDYETYTEWVGKKKHEHERVQTPGNAGEKAIPFSERGIEIEKRIKEYANKLHRDGDYITDIASAFKLRDLAVLTTEYGVEYTLLTIGEKSYLIRGDEKGTTIPQKLVERLLRNKGTFDGHSHPYIGDVIPSAADREFLKALTWQKDSVIIDPTQNAYKYSADGSVEPYSIDSMRESDYYSSFFAEGGE